MDYRIPTSGAAAAAHAIITEPPKLGKPEPSEEEKIAKTREYSIIEGIAATFAGAFGESYITAFAVAMNSSNTLIALLTAVPNLIAPIAQAFTPKMMEKYGRKRLVVPGVFLQACMWIAIAFVAFLFMQGFAQSPYLLLLFFTMYAILGNFMAPAWTSWMGDIVPKNKGEYWAKRSTICGAVGLVLTLTAGIFLDAFSNINLMLAFMTMFGISFIGRSMSSYFFTKHYEPKLKLPKNYYFSFFEFIKKIQTKGNNFGKYAMFITFGVFAGYIAWPFIPVYMLRELHFDYTIFTIVTLTESLFTILTFGFWGKYVDKHGDLKVLRISSMGLFVIPLLWAGSALIPSAAYVVYYLIAVQIFRGIIGAAFSISTTNFLFDAVTPQRRSLCSAYAAILNGIGIFFGAIIGGVLLSSNLPAIAGINAFIFIFVVSGIARIILTAIFLPRIKEVNKNALAIDGGTGTKK
jgi:MFS family permease